jgi:putative sigma-54 modulation protein
MNIAITFRHMDASRSIKAYAREKVAKLQKFLRQPMTARVTLSLDKLEHVAESRISSGGEHLEAREQSQDMYASIDKMVDKLERIIRGTKGAKEAKARRSGASLRLVPADTTLIEASSEEEEAQPKARKAPKPVSSRSQKVAKAPAAKKAARTARRAAAT